MKNRWLRYIGGVILLAFAMILGQQIGISLSIRQTNASPFWPPSGIALGALLLFGLKYWPGVALGVLVGAAFQPFPIPTLIAITIGSTLEAVVPVYLLKKLFWVEPVMEKLRDATLLATIGGVGGSLLAAVWNTTAVWLFGPTPTRPFLNEMAFWWMGDLVGILLVAPFILVWSRRPLWRDSMEGKRNGEFILLCATLTLTSFIVFTNAKFYPAIVFPFFLWAALRFYERGVTITTLMVTLIAAWTTARQVGPFATPDPSSGMMELVLLISVTAVSMFFLALIMRSHQQVENELRTAQRELEERVKARTVDLQAANQRLQTELIDRTRTETALQQSQEKLRALFETSPEAIAIMDNDGRFLMINEQMLLRFLYTDRTELVDSQVYFFELFTRKDRPLIRSRLVGVLESNKVSVNEYTALRKDGSTFPVEVSLRPMQRVHDAPEGFTAVIRDVTDRKEAEAALRASEEKYRELVFHQGEGIGIVDAREVFTFANPAAEAIFGVQPGSLMGRNLQEFTHKETINAIQKQMVPQANGHRTAYEMEINQLNGELRILAVTATPRYDIAGNYTGAFGIFRDITETRQAQELQHRRLRELTALRNTMKDIASELELEKLLTKIVEELVQLFGPVRVDLLEYDESRDELEVLVSQQRGRDIRGIRVHMGEGLAGIVAQERKSLIIEHYGSWAKKTGRFDTPEEATVIGAPMLAGHRLLGVLDLVADPKVRKFNEEDLHLLEMFAQEAAVAIHNANLFSEVQRLATQDSLTGLYNRRVFFSMAQRELERARRYHNSMALLLFDIDNFKLVNDTHGHMAGDLVLEQLANLCRQTVRQADIIGRYGGEEFIILLIETNEEESLNVAERLRQEIEGMIVPYDESRIKITVSLGLAELSSEKDLTLDKLINRADQALYVSKNRGRNCVTFWSSELPVQPAAKGATT